MVSFTMDVYTEVIEELADNGASAIAAYVPPQEQVRSRRDQRWAILGRK